MPKASDYFIFDCEAHIMPWEFRKHVSYYPGSAYFSNPAETPTGKWWNINPITKERREKPSDWTDLQVKGAKRGLAISHAGVGSHVTATILMDPDHLLKKDA